MFLANKTTKLNSYTASFSGNNDVKSYNEESEIYDLASKYNIKKNLITCSKKLLLSNLNEI